ncbi:MAG: Bacterial regulatory protein gntR family [Gaiellales bacterium]|nr:Bacterial regulatory protein gntR family [Gaiellales bacterium]
MIAVVGIRPRDYDRRMPARVNFVDAGVAFDADGALAPAAQLVAKLRLAIDAGAIPEGATLPSIRAGAAELGVHSNTLRKVYAALEAQGYATTRHGSGTVAHVRDAAGAAAVRRIADGALASARGAGADAQLVALAILAGADATPARPAKAARAPAQTAPPRRAARSAARAPKRSHAPVLPPDIRRGAHVGLVTNDEALVTRALAEAGRRGVRLRVAGPDDGQTLGDLVWGCELVIVGRDARDDETAQRVLRSARDVLEMA